MHLAVLQEEFLQLYKDKAIRTFLDATLGAGGHSKLLLQQHPEIQHLYGIDQDTRALALAQQELAPYAPHVHYIHANFAAIDEVLPQSVQLDGALFDLGVSSMQLDNPEYGMSFRFDAPLDMRMNCEETTLTAATIINQWSEADLADLFFTLGEERHSRKAAHAIVTDRKKKKFTSTLELASLLEKILPRHGRIHPATKIFQALRIAVNDELNCMKKGLQAAVDRLCDGGRISVISFHSLEDRIVKQFFRARTDLKIITKKPLTASLQERRQNRRSSSAKMRCAEKIMSAPQTLS